jgi:hypothetical protein
LQTFFFGICATSWPWRKKKFAKHNGGGISLAGGKQQGAHEDTKSRHRETIRNFQDSTTICTSNHTAAWITVFQKVSPSGFANCHSQNRNASFYAAMFSNILFPG